MPQPAYLVPFAREAQLAQLTATPEWDIIIIGGGATGLGAALDAVSRGYKTLLLEQADFAKGTSSRSTKLVHGGVRYLAQGNVRLVHEALRERGLLRRNAPHLVRDLRFVIPAYRWWNRPWYLLGLKLYDLLAGRRNLGAARLLGRNQVLGLLGNAQPAALRGGVLYHDGQFDDARLALNVAQTCVAHGATVLNYLRVTSLRKDTAGCITGVRAEDLEDGTAHELRARAVINATGVFVDELRRLDEPATTPLVQASQGVHVVVARRFLPGPAALLIPRTADGRVLFAVPWLDHVVLGTTDTPVATASLEPRALPAEVDFILRTAGRYLAQPPTRADVLSVWAGLRPLAAANGSSTKELSRSHQLHVSPAGLLTVTGGKWTTFRQMGQDAVAWAQQLGQLPPRPSRSAALRIHGAPAEAEGAEFGTPYGTDQPQLDALLAQDAAWRQPLDAELPILAGQVVWAARHEMACTVEDVLARRNRALFLNAAAAARSAPAVAQLLAQELGRDDAWAAAQVQAFRQLAAEYQLPPPTL
ncbi:glycerol-3-phosphate dehydrogenase/oxidase [Hymenobacter sp. CRA2]|uniref:glycerol-3-phosphate dehydrogenase/oxidase n=1 Tax=Hymenobacter sp. CRA2 TaxID=1955620 RepID=UPI00099024C8|nr:glycerol-3-phosphate dehydrogenase/oxidase [Hymenobacter sp. CRA2]OON70088.1 FAD-dependent oxidoreductase [Hymenobacter sp. CRA2]